MTAIATHVRQIPLLLRGDTECIDRWLQRREPARVALYGAVILVGAGVYGSPS